METTFEGVYERHKTFANKVFVNATPEACLKHLKTEIKELEAEAENAGTDSELIELSDCFICLLSYAAKRGYTAEQLVFGIDTKVGINENRQWAENPDGTYSHIKQ